MRIALLDDEPAETERLSQILSSEGFHTDTFNNSEQFVKLLHRESFDLIVVDWEMPKMSGIEVVSWVRKSMNLTVPMIFVTNLGSEACIMEGLDAGADDYLIKPVRRGEFLSRVKAALRRTAPALSPKKTEPYGNYVFHPFESKVFVDEEEINLTPKELALSLLLFRNLDKALSRAHIQKHVWGNDNVTTRSMDAHLSRLRAKIKLNQGNGGFHLMPIYNFGYRLVKQE